MTSHVLCDHYPVTEREREREREREKREREKRERERRERERNNIKGNTDSIQYNTGLYSIILSHWSDTSLIVIRVYKRIAHNKNNIVCKTIIDKK